MRKLSLTAVFIALLAPCLAAAAIDPPLERGFHPDGSFQSLDIDHIDLSRTAMTMTIALGKAYPVGGGVSYAFMLTYSSEAWDMLTQDGCPTYDTPCYWTTAVPSRISSAGLSWSLTLGKLIDPAESSQFHPYWSYVGPDGADHSFLATLHEGETVTSGWMYTRDATYMRLHVNGATATVEMADGTIHTFTLYDSVNHRWRLTSIADRFNNTVSVTYDTDGQGRPRWTVTDSTGRTHYALFNASSGHVELVDLAAFNGTRAQYTFTYAWPKVRRTCLDDDVTSSDYLNDPPVPGSANSIPFLVTVGLPDSTTYSMTSGGTPTYNVCCGTNCTGATSGNNSSGTLRQILGPPGGGIAWTYADLDYYWEEPFYFGGGWVPRPNYLNWAGVATRTSLDAAGQPMTGYQRTYKTDYNKVWSPSTVDGNNNRCGRRPEARFTAVTGPDGNGTVHYFGAYPGTTGRNYAEYGLNFTARVWDCDKSANADCSQVIGQDVPWGGRYLSTQYFSGAVTADDDGDTCDPSNLSLDQYTGYWQCGALKTPVRTTYRWYYSDGGAALGGHRHANHHLASERTDYPDDPFNANNRYQAVNNSDFDGLGHFRQSDSVSNFDAGGTRTMLTDYNPSAGTYPGSFTLPSLGSPWILETYDYQQQTDSSGSAKQEYCFDSTNGFLKRTRTLKTGTSRSANDLLAVFTPDPAGTGNVTREEYYGGDSQGSVGVGPVCDNLIVPADNQYRIDHTYQYGVRRTSRYVDSAGTPLSFYTLDLDIDQNTGLASASYQASTGTKTQGDYVAGIKTQFVYDALGRLTWEKPDSGHGAYVHHQYLKYNTCAAPARVESCTKPNGTTTECVDTAASCNPLADSLTRTAVHFDVLGRVFGEFTKYTSSLWNQRLADYDGMNRKAAVSEWQASGTSGSNLRRTIYSGFDVFSRPTTITPPDGAGHNITLSYVGNRVTTRTAKVATSASAEADSTTTEEYDGQGRLWKVTEPSGSAGANVTTTYTYDVGKRLSGASTTSGATTQTRTFNYDNRGFLTSEQLPEKGSTGNGAVSYASYDARGHVGAVTDGPSGATISYCYDRAERTTLVASPSTSCTTPVSTSKRKEFTYGTNNNGSDKRNGKLVTALRHNWISGTDYPVSESYTYAGVGGRTSARTTSVDGRSISQVFTWNDLSSLSWQQYPDDSAVADPTRKVINTYSLGFLTGVCEGSTPPTCTTNYASSISYHPSLMVNQVVHANGVTDTYAKDDNDMRRPKSIATSGSAANWSTGNYQFDGSGNIWKIGASEVFIYDKANRLTSGTILAAGVTRTQTAGYDAFGNMTTTTTHYGTRNFTVSGTTNHVTNLSFAYDAAGNQTGWSDGSQTYTYAFTPLNEVLTYTTLGVNHTYLYTADGERVEDWDNTANTRTISVRDLAGKVLRLHTRNSSGVWSWSKDYVYRDGLQVASVESTGTKHFHLDHLGTIRRVTGTGSPAAVLAGHDLYPFGLEATSITQDSERMKFTGHERDLHFSSTQNDDLDDMHARYYNPNVARFLSVDPGRDVDPKVPQAWNMYAYVRNNPVNKVDPDGKMMVNAAILAAVQTDKDGNKKLVPMPPEQQQRIATAVTMLSPMPLSAATTTKAAQMLANAAQGKVAEALAAKQLEAAGNTILGSRVAAVTSLGRRVIDFLVRTPADEIAAYEVKSGGAVRNGMQVAKDAEMGTTGAVLVGKNAPDDLKVAVQVIITTVLRMP